MDTALLEWAKRPDLRVGRGILAPAVEALSGDYVLISQPQPLRQVDAAIVEAAVMTLEADSLEEADLRRLATAAPKTANIVGIGGGMVMDAAKYVAWKCGAHLLLAPSIISVDASVTNTVAVRREGRVEYHGFVVADPIVADLELIAAAPARLNRAGVGDLLSIQTGRFDWALGAQAGRISFDDRIDAAAAHVLEQLYGVADEVFDVTDGALEHIIRAYVTVNALLLEAGHSGPEEGSEHYFAYAVEAATGRSFVHGELVALGTVLMSHLQDGSGARTAAFLDRCGVEWRPGQLGLDREVLVEVMAGLPRFVSEAGLPYSVIDQTAFDDAAIANLLSTIGMAPSTAAHHTATGGSS